MELTSETSAELYITSIGRKVLYCGGCQTADFDEPIITTLDDGKTTTPYCPYCAEHLTLRSEDRISHNTLGKPLGDKHSKRSWVIRLIPTPWGKLRFAVSTHANQCYNAFFIPALMDSGDRDKRGNPIMYRGVPIPTGVDTIWYYPESNASMVKELINDDFSEASLYSAWQKLEGHKIGLVAFSKFLDTLKEVVHHVHTSVNPVLELDLEGV
jgi:uncharacterized Zn-finger protein